MFDRPKNSMLGPLPGVNQSRKYLRTFLCHRISFCLFSSSPFLAKKDMYKGRTIRKVIGGRGGGEGNSRAAGIFFLYQITGKRCLDRVINLIPDSGSKAL